VAGFQTFDRGRISTFADNRQFEIEFLDSGVEAFAFTFG
jgi:hypothetical protein